MQSVWLFHGTGGRFTSAVFSDREKAEEWVSEHSLSGMLTEYPTNISAYNWAVKKGYFKVRKEHQSSPKFIQNFTSATQAHFHYEDGVRLN